MIPGRLAVTPPHSSRMQLPTPLLDLDGLRSMQTTRLPRLVTTSLVWTSSRACQVSRGSSGHCEACLHLPILGQHLYKHTFCITQDKGHVISSAVLGT